jgi:hypothetical protein
MGSNADFWILKKRKNMKANTVRVVGQIKWEMITSVAFASRFYRKNSLICFGVCGDFERAGNNFLSADFFSY